MVINMKINKVIKTRLYFALSVLLLTAVCVMVYTSMRNGNGSVQRNDEPGQGQHGMVEQQTDELWQVSSTPRQEAAGQGTAATEEKNEMTDAVAQEDPQEITYHLVAQDGWLQVYVVQTGQLYMETGIAYDLLPQRVQLQIQEGKYFQSEEAMLEFLENYSS